MKRLMIDLVQLSCMFAIVMGIVIAAATLLIREPSLEQFVSAAD